jgi:hypothetical protein
MNPSDALLHQLDELCSALASRLLTPKPGTTFPGMVDSLRPFLTSGRLTALRNSKCLQMCEPRIGSFFGCLMRFLVNHRTKPLKNHLAKFFDDIKRGSEIISNYMSAADNALNHAQLAIECELFMNSIESKPTAKALFYFV